MAGRIYDVKPKATGERKPRAATVSHRGRKIKFVTRIEFDGDSDSGPATVTAFFADAGGTPIVGLDRQAVTVTFRADVAIEHRASFVEEENVEKLAPPKDPDFHAAGERMAAQRKGHYEARGGFVHADGTVTKMLTFVPADSPDAPHVVGGGT